MLSRHNDDFVLKYFCTTLLLAIHAHGEVRHYMQFERQRHFISYNTIAFMIQFKLTLFINPCHFMLFGGSIAYLGGGWRTTCPLSTPRIGGPYFAPSASSVCPRRGSHAQYVDVHTRYQSCIACTCVCTMAQHIPFMHTCRTVTCHLYDSTVTLMHLDIRMYSECIHA